MKKILLNEKKSFFKANLHCHSNFSDGKLSVEELKCEYMKRGYKIIAFTDHEHIINNSHLNEPNKFLAITSAELSVKEFKDQSTLKKKDMKVGHFNIYALEQNNDITPCYSKTFDHFINESNKNLIRFNGDYDRCYSPEGINKFIEDIKAQGFLVTYNHPSWSLEDATDYKNYKGLFAVEIRNTGCLLSGYADDEHAYDDLLKNVEPLFCVAADDNHNYSPMDTVKSDSFGNWVQINAERLEYNTVMTALKNGDFYSSYGPEISNLYVEDNKVYITTSPAEKIIYSTGVRHRETAFADFGKTITQGVFEIEPTDKYFRLIVIDKSGKKAYTNAYFLKDLGF